VDRPVAQGHGAANHGESGPAEGRHERAVEEKDLDGHGDQQPRVQRHHPRVVALAHRAAAARAQAGGVALRDDELDDPLDDHGEQEDDEPFL